MPITRNRAQPTLRAGRRSRAGSTASIPSDETDTADEGAPVAQFYGNMAGMLTDDQRPFQVQGEDETENIEEDEEGGEDEDPEKNEGTNLFMAPFDITADVNLSNLEQVSDNLSLQAQTHAALTPRGLKEISSLASWTVSTSKPGCGVAALRSSDTSLFWQSDGPQPHLLSIHFFKLVSIAHMRIFLDFDNDESYTPTKMQFLAGMGVYDLQEFAEMTFEQPRGWIDVDFSQVGPIEADEDGEDDEEALVNWEKRPLLRCFLVQVKILENHQNGKDTHLRGFQIFARDERADEVRERRESLDQDRQERALTMAERPKASKKRSDVPRLRKADWMMEPEMR